MADIQHAVPV